MNDRIELRGIEVLARHGVLEHEQVESQTFLVDLVLHLDLSAAGRSDDLDDTVDYGELARATHDLVAKESHQLIETVAERVAQQVLGDSRVDRVVVTVHKPQAPIPVGFEDVAVVVDRRR
ncbi:MAG TPA: dihydroneopterin aldolase [Acidimicrobiia bacterium]|nr:dihydroneopterin aldolase [Acidimicrobiia bacterium]